MSGEHSQVTEGVSLCVPQSKYSFDTFICGESNLLAYKAAIAVASGVATYNPLFLIGRDGLGKTHLLHAIANHLTADQKTKKVVYCTSEQFMAELLANLRSNKMAQFRCKFRNLDVLLLDDIQFLAGKERTQEELFHTFDALYESKKQIVMTSDRLPSKIANTDAHLKGRFQCGLSIRIEVPERETRLEFIRRKAATLNVQLSESVVQFLASGTLVNFRELEGSVITVSAFSSLRGKPLTVELAQEALGIL
ncbi:chromosomal replication initiator protein DnaA [Geomonas edaphica]|uniref:chromosomal replication initiator protein DnaA n=1 Tax=Geomonas edaphica TaxID=2570226 RepID=UPI0010A7CFB2|nr:chromosomal replication initiator protein DnaA [Geomonas edaphica]